MSAWLAPLPPSSWGAKTELLAQTELKLLTRPFKVRRLTIRSIGIVVKVLHTELNNEFSYLTLVVRYVVLTRRLAITVSRHT